MIDPEMSDFLQYMIHDEDGNVIGLSEDAPQEAWKHYNQWNDLCKQGIKA